MSLTVSTLKFCQDQGSVEASRVMEVTKIISRHLGRTACVLKHNHCMWFFSRFQAKNHSECSNGCFGDIVSKQISDKVGLSMTQSVSSSVSR